MATLSMSAELAQTVASKAAAAAAAAQPGAAAQPMAPTAPVAECPGRLLPMYRFASVAASANGPTPRMRRISSYGDSLVRVPDTDESPSLSSSGSSSDDLLCLMHGSHSSTNLGAVPGSPSSADEEGQVPRSSALAAAAAAAAAGPAAKRARFTPAADDLQGGVVVALGGEDQGEEEEEQGAQEQQQEEEEDVGGGLLELALTALWDDAMSRGLFRYDLSSIETKSVPGRLRFIAQLNEGRATKKRPTEFRTDAVVQSFDAAKFNFRKAAAQEVLFQFEPSYAAPRSELLDGSACGSSPNLVFINVSPIDYGHVLLVPRVLDCLPQLVDPSTLELALSFAEEAGSSRLRVGYNSLGAYATINHLHYQAYYQDAPFPCELVPTESLQGLKRRRDGISIRRLLKYPVNAFVVEVDATTHATASPEERAALRADVAQLAGTACMRLAAMNQPHNLLICEAGRRVFLFPQCFAEQLAKGAVPDDLMDTGVNPAAFEIAGHMLLKRQEDYDSMSEADMYRLLSYASLPEERFLQLARLCFGPKQQQE